MGIGYAFTTGSLTLDPVLRIQDADVELHTAVLSYTRYFALFDQTARLDVHTPFQSGRWQGLVDGVPTTVHRDGLADPILRLSANLVGAPALRGQEFFDYRREHSSQTTVGAALELRVPLGEYMADKLINLGQNRFVIGPQLGVLHTHGEWSFEGTGTMFVFTDNDDFFNGSELEQEPSFALQTHVVKTFENGCWLSLGAAYGWAGESKVDGVRQGDAKSNLLFGSSFGFRIGEAQSIRIGYFRGDTLTDVGSDTHNVFAGWAIRF